MNVVLKLILGDSRNYLAVTSFVFLLADGEAHEDSVYPPIESM